MSRLLSAAITLLAASLVSALASLALPTPATAPRLPAVYVVVETVRLKPKAEERVRWHAAGKHAKPARHPEAWDGGKATIAPCAPLTEVAPPVLVRMLREAIDGTGEADANVAGGRPP